MTRTCAIHGCTHRPAFDNLCTKHLGLIEDAFPDRHLRMWPDRRRTVHKKKTRWHVRIEGAEISLATAASWRDAMVIATTGIRPAEKRAAA